MSPKPVDPLAAVVADWNEDRAPSPFEKLMWRTEVRPMLRSTGMLLELLDHAPDHERESGLALGAPVDGVHPASPSGGQPGRRAAGASCRREAPADRLQLFAGLSFVLLTFSRGVVVELYRASALLGIGTGLSMAALATLIVANVSQAETGAAAGVNNVARTLRGAIGGRTARPAVRLAYRC